MPPPQELDYWIKEVSTAFEGLSGPQSRVLALYSYGMVMTCHGGQTIVASFLAVLLGVRWQAMRQRLREWTYEAGAKRGKQRRSVGIEGQFAPLLRWILSYWSSQARLMLVLDVTYLRQRHTILMVSVVYRGCALPVAWQVMRGETEGAWHPLWVGLLTQLAPVIPASCQVWVLCDGGLYSKRLFEVICQQGWHPVMRIRTQGLYRRARATRWRALATVATRGMPCRSFRSQCFKGDPLACTLWVQWPTRYEQPCLLVTDLAPKHLKRHVYGLRSWIECGFKDLKRGGLHWEQSKITCPERMQRLLLVMALAMVWLICQGVASETSGFPELVYVPLSAMRRGWITTLVSALLQRPLPFAYCPPYALPPLPA